MMVAHSNLHGLGFAIPRRRINGAGIARRTVTATRTTGGPLFTDPKLNAMREAAIAGDWVKLFKIQPRGCLRRIDHGLSRMDGTYGQCAEPAAYGGSDVADHPQGRRDYLWWLQNNPLRKQLTINDLRVTKDASGRVVPVPYQREEVERYYRNHTLSKGEWGCEEGQIQRYINTAMAGSHPIYPIALCAVPSRRRRRKILKKIAIVGAAVTGGVLLGKFVIGKVGAALAGKGGAAASAAAAKGAAGAAVGAVKAGGLVAAAAKAVPIATGVINSVRTIKAIKDGELPPPPISIGDGNFSDYASLVARELAQREMGKRITQSEQDLLDQYVEQERRRLAAAEVPHLPVVNTGLHPALTAAQRTRADVAISDSTLFKFAAIGIPAALLLVMAVRS